MAKSRFNDADYHTGDSERAASDHSNTQTIAAGLTSHTQGGNGDGLAFVGSRLDEEQTTKKQKTNGDRFASKDQALGGSLYEEARCPPAIWANREASNHRTTLQTTPAEVEGAKKERLMEWLGHSDRPLLLCNVHVGKEESAGEKVEDPNTASVDDVEYGQASKKSDRGGGWGVWK